MDQSTAFGAQQNAECTDHGKFQLFSQLACPKVIQPGQVDVMSVRIGDDCTFSRAQAVGRQPIHQGLRDVDYLDPVQFSLMSLNS